MKDEMQTIEQIGNQDQEMNLKNAPQRQALFDMLGNMQEDKHSLEEQRIAIFNILDDINQSKNELERKYLEIEALKDLTQKLGTSLEVSTVMKHIVETFRKLFPESTIAYAIAPIQLFEFPRSIYIHTKIDLGEKYLAEIQKKLKSSLKKISGLKKEQSKLQKWLRGKFDFQFIEGQKNKKSKNILISQVNIPIVVPDMIGGVIHLSSNELGFFGVKEREIVATVVDTAIQTITRLRALVASEHSRLDDLIKSMTNGVLMFDSNKQLIVTNPALKHIAQIKHKQFTFNDFLVLFTEVKVGPQQDLFDIVAAIDQLLKSGKSFHLEEVTRKNKFFEIFITPVRDYQRNVCGGAIILHDITTRKENERKIQERNKKLQIEKSKDEAILSSLGDGVLVIGNNKKVILLNTAAEELLGYNANIVLNKNFRNFFKFCYEDTECLSPEKLPLDEILEAGEVFVSDPAKGVFIEKSNGVHFPAYMKVTPIIDDDEIIGAVIIFRDITKEQEIDRMKTEFVSVASHQLRTPLTAIKLFTEMLANEEVGKLTTEQLEYLDNVQQSTSRMIQLVNHLLNVSRLESGKLKIEPKPIKLAGFVQDIINEIIPLASESDCKIVFRKSREKLPKISIDSSLMRQVIHNLITNAVRYSQGEGYSVTVSLHRKIPKTPKGIVIGNKQILEDSVVVMVQDNGIGIPKEVQSRIFDRFFRADNAIKTQSEGSGLGLYVAKMIIEASGGQIWFESKHGKGAAFYVSIPTKGMKKKKGEKSIAF